MTPHDTPSTQSRSCDGQGCDEVFPRTSGHTAQSHGKTFCSKTCLNRFQNHLASGAYR